MEIQDLIKTFHQGRHTEFQCDAFITQRNGVTIFGMMRQSVRELNTRITRVREGNRAVQRLQVERLILNRGLSTTDVLERQLVELDMEAKEDEIRHAVFSFQSLIHEIRVFWSQVLGCYRDLVNEHQELTPKVLDALEQDFWAEKYLADAIFSAASLQSPSSDLRAHVQQLDKEVSRPVASMLMNLEDLAKKAKKYRFPDVPRAPLPTIEQIRSLCLGPDVQWCPLISSQFSDDSSRYALEIGYSGSDSDSKAD